MNERRYATLPWLFLCGSIFLCLTLVTEQGLAQTYDFDEGITALAHGLIAVKKDTLKHQRIAVFGIVESKSRERWDISSHIEDGIVDVLVNNGFTITERRRINDIIQKELKKGADFWFDQTQVTEVGKLVGADVVITGRYVKWGGGTLRISIRAINVSDGKVMAANKVKIHTDRIAELLRPAAQAAEEERTEFESTQERGSPQPRAPGQTNAPVSPPQAPQVPATPQMGYFCCDQFGNRRCQLVQPVPLGTPCFCPGQGWGYACE